jgi:hypothetical protein
VQVLPWVWLGLVPFDRTLPTRTRGSQKKYVEMSSARNDGNSFVLQEQCLVVASSSTARRCQNWELIIRGTESISLIPRTDESQQKIAIIWHKNNFQKNLAVSLVDN